MFVFWDIAPCSMVLTASIISVIITLMIQAVDISEVLTASVIRAMITLMMQAVSTSEI
jgi:hypothetical protein